MSVLLLRRQELTHGAGWVRQHPQPRSDRWAAILRSAGIAFIFSGGSKDTIHTWCQAVPDPTVVHILQAHVLVEQWRQHATQCVPTARWVQAARSIAPTSYVPALCFRPPLSSPPHLLRLI